MKTYSQPADNSAIPHNGSYQRSVTTVFTSLQTSTANQTFSSYSSLYSQ